MPTDRDAALESLNLPDPVHVVGTCPNAVYFVGGSLQFDKVGDRLLL